MCLSNIFCNSRKWRHPVFNARAYLLLLTEFGGKGGPHLKSLIARWGDTEMG